MPASILPPFEPDELQPVYNYTAEIGDLTLRLVVDYKSRQDVWYLSIYTADDEETPILTGYRLNLEPDPTNMSNYQLPALGIIGDGSFASAPWFGVLDAADSWAECDFDALGDRCFVYQYYLGEWFIDMLEALADLGLISYDAETGQIESETAVPTIDVGPTVFPGFGDGYVPAQVIIAP